MKFLKIIAPWLIVIGAVIDSVFGLLPELGLSQTQIRAVQVVGLIIAVVLRTIKTNEEKEFEKDGTKPPIGGGGGTPPKP